MGEHKEEDGWIISRDIFTFTYLDCVVSLIRRRHVYTVFLESVEEFHSVDQYID